MEPFDLVVLLKAIELPGVPPSVIAHHLEVPTPEVREALDRAQDARLYSAHRQQVNRIALQEFLLHAVRYMFPARPHQGSRRVRGLPTAWSAPPLSDRLWAGPGSTVVWPMKAEDVPTAVRERLVLGDATIPPLDPRVPRLAARDASLYRWLTLLDALRAGRARDIVSARDELQVRLATA